MWLLDLILRGGKTPGKEQQSLEDRLYSEDLARKIQVRLGQEIELNKLRGIYYSKDEVIGITPKDRILFHVWKMKPVKKNDLVFKDDKITDIGCKNIYSRKHFEAIAEGLKWDCEILMSENGKAPALFRTDRANIWLAPIIELK